MYVNGLYMYRKRQALWKCVPAFSVIRIGYVSSDVYRLRAHAQCMIEREFFVDSLLVRIYLIIEMIFVDRPCVMGF